MSAGPPDQPEPPEPPDQLGPYRILRRLGHGGMGTVYDALDTTLDRHVALKLISPELAHDPELRLRFVREAQAQASLDSPHVVHVFAHGEIDGQLFIATQLVPDGDLARHLRRHGPLPREQAAAIVAQVADGLAEAHRVGLVHRDIKPSNVLLRHRGPDTVAYLADFGIAAPAAGEGTAADVAALGRLLEACLRGPDARLARVVGAARSAAEVRDGLRPPARPTRRLRPATVAAGVVLVVAAAAVVAVEAGSDPEPGDDPAVARIARQLQADAGLDPASATCTARRLAGQHGVEALREQELDVALAAAAACLWSPR